MEAARTSTENALITLKAIARENETARE